MAYVVISDVHLHNWSPFSKVYDTGVNSRLQSILDSIKQATAGLKKNDRLYITGDLFHVRGHITPSVLNPTIDLFKELIKRGIIVRLIPGNHDLESKSTQRLTNAVQALEAIGCDVCNETTTFKDDRVIMIPWIDNLGDLREEMTRVSTLDPSGMSDYSLMIHAPLNGVVPIPDNGLFPEELAGLGFKRVFCGHYHHHKIFDEGVMSVGAVVHQTWSDVNTIAGYILVDDKDELTHIEPAAPKFIDFDDAWDDVDCAENCGGNYVRVKLGEATEKEIREIREAIMNEHGALGCVIKSVPAPVGVTRSASVKSGASIEKSIEDWIGDNIDTQYRQDVSMASLAILEEVATNEE